MSWDEANLTGMYGPRRKNKPYRRKNDPLPPLKFKNINYVDTEAVPIQHGVDVISWNNLSKQFRGACLCEWETEPSECVEDVGRDFDNHFKQALQ